MHGNEQRTPEKPTPTRRDHRPAATPLPVAAGLAVGAHRG
jgi:hypothetical protein